MPQESFEQLRQLLFQDAALQKLQKDTAKFHVEEPSMNYLDDSEEKRIEANDFARQVAEEWTGPFCEELESMRLNSQPVLDRREK